MLAQELTDAGSPAVPGQVWTLERNRAQFGPAPYPLTRVSARRPRGRAEGRDRKSWFIVKHVADPVTIGLVAKRKAQQRRGDRRLGSSDHRQVVLNRTVA